MSEFRKLVGKGPILRKFTPHEKVFDHVTRSHSQAFPDKTVNPQKNNKCIVCNVNLLDFSHREGRNNGSGHLYDDSSAPSLHRKNKLVKNKFSEIGAPKMSR